jgi:hypothetical protein
MQESDARQVRVKCRSGRNGKILAELAVVPTFKLTTMSLIIASE